MDRTFHADTIRTLTSHTLSSLESETWMQTVILRADSTGALVPVEAVVVHTSTAEQREELSADTSHTVADVIQHDTSTKETTPETIQANPYKGVAACFASAAVFILFVWAVSSDKFIKTIKNKIKAWTSRY